MLATLSTLALLAAPPEDVAARGNHPVRLVVTSPEAPQVRGKVPAFQATQILDLQLEAIHRRRLPGEHVAEFKVYTPKGHVYQVIAVPFTGDDRPGRRSHRRLQGYPGPVAEQAMKAKPASGFHVTARLPVAGTWIVNSSLYGTWRVDLHLDGSEEPLAQAAFTLAP